MKQRRFLAIGLAAAALAVPAAADAVPITPASVPTTLPAFTGAPARAHRIKAILGPQNPFMAKNPNSNIHNDTWMTDAYQRRGPLGRSLVARSEAKPPSLCGSLAFDRRGRIVSICPSTLSPPQARIIDPKSLATIASYDLPNAPDPPGTKAFQNFTGGGYFFLDARDRIWAATKTNHIFVIAESPDGQSLVKRRDFDLNGVLTPDERVTSALPGFDGLIWFVSKASGKVGTLNRKTGAIHVLRTGEEIENSFAVGRGGIFIVSDKRMYRFRASKKGRPYIVWKSTYRNSGIVKPSQLDAGSGTTPTLMSGGYVAITDNADPMNIVVYRRAPRLKRGQKRVVCQVPVFGKGASATENTLLTAGRSLIVVNNYGYQDPFGPTGGAATVPGFARIDVLPGGRGCRKVWTNRTERGSSVVPKLSTRTGLIYTYVRKDDLPGSQPYFWSAIDFRTGRTAWTQYAGSGLSFNNNYAGIALGSGGTAYLGVIGGIIKLRDGP